MLDYSLKLFNFSIKESLNLSLGCDWGWREDGGSMCVAASIREQDRAVSQGSHHSAGRRSWNPHFLSYSLLPPSFMPLYLNFSRVYSFDL